MNSIKKYQIGEIKGTEGLPPFEIRKNPNSKRIKMTFRNDCTILISLPMSVSYKRGIEFMLSNKKWILERANKYKAQHKEENLSDEERIKKLNALIKEAKAYLPQRLDYLAEKYGFKYNRLCIKNNRSNWGSCAKQRGNINLSLRLMLVPEKYRDYVILHELCHLVYANHGKDFHNLLESLCIQELGEGHLKLKKELNSYIMPNYL